MQRDLKIGLSLGVLLVGVVGAFFNRREVPTNDPEEHAQTAQQLDERIAERPHKPYLTGIEADDFPAPASSAKRPALRQTPPQFSLEEFAADHETPPPSPGPKQRAASPDTSEERPAATAERGQPAISNAVTERAPSVHSISVTSIEPRAASQSLEPEAETSTVPSAEALEGESRRNGAAAAPAEAPKKEPMFTRPKGSPFTRKSQPGSTKSNEKSSSGQNSDSKGKKTTTRSRLAPKAGSAKASAEKEDRSQASAAGNAPPGLYKVKAGDSLDKIALQYYRNKGKAQAIFEANKDQLKNPDAIREGMQIKLP